MRICFFTDTFFPLVGGAEMVLHHLASELKHSGHEPVVLAPRIRGGKTGLATDYPVHRYTPPSSKRLLIRQMLLPLAWLHSRYRFGVLHCHAGYPQAYVGATFTRLFRVPMVVRPHGSDIVPGGRIRQHPRLEKRLSKGLKSAAAIIAQGSYLSGLIKELGVPAEKIHIIHNGVAVNAFRNTNPFPHGRPYIVALGNLIHRKGFDILLRAFAGLESREIDLLIAGDGPEQDALASLAHDLGINKRVRFLGFVEGQTKADLLGSARLMVCPSRNEPFANAILEGLAAGIPIIASAVGGNTQLIEHNERGLLFQSEDVTGLTAELQSLLADRPLQETMRQNIRQYIQQFDWKYVAQKYLDVYNAVI